MIRPQELRANSKRANHFQHEGQRTQRCKNKSGVSRQICQIPRIARPINDRAKRRHPGGRQGQRRAAFKHARRARVTTLPGVVVALVEPEGPVADDHFDAAESACGGERQLDPQSCHLSGVVHPPPQRAPVEGKTGRSASHVDSRDHGGVEFSLVQSGHGHLDWFI